MASRLGVVVCAAAHCNAPLPSLEAAAASMGVNVAAKAEVAVTQTSYGPVCQQLDYAGVEFVVALLADPSAVTRVRGCTAVPILTGWLPVVGDQPIEAAAAVLPTFPFAASDTKGAQAFRAVRDALVDRWPAGDSFAGSREASRGSALVC